MLVRFYVFADYGQTYSLNTAAPRDPVSLFGTGCGLDANVGEHFDLRLMLGVPLINPPGSDKPDPLRITFSVGMQL
jgi:hemolysin activation/secretion protein